MTNAELLIVVLLFAIGILLLRLCMGLNQVILALQAIYDQRR